MKRIVKRKTVAQRIAEGMGELEQAMRSGKPLREQFTVHTMEIAAPGDYDAAAIRQMRHGLQVSQAVFAKLLGVSAELVEHWEQGVCVPRRLACRLLDEIKRDPGGFLARHVGQSGRGLRKAG